MVLLLVGYVLDLQRACLRPGLLSVSALFRRIVFVNLDAVFFLLVMLLAF